MSFRNESRARECLQTISYYRLQCYCCDERVNAPQQIYFEDIMDRYEFDRKLRLILFSGIEQIEIAVRTKLVNYMSLAHGELWYRDAALFESTGLSKNGVVKTAHLHVLDEMQKEFGRSQELFIRDHRLQHPSQPAESWKILEVTSMGTLSKLYKNLKTNLPQRGLISKEMGINSPRVFASWLEAIALIRNITAHHSHLWSRTMEKRPKMQLNNPYGPWFSRPFMQGQLDKPFATISCMIYLCCWLSKSDEIKHQIKSLIRSYPSVPVYKYGFFNYWESEPLWS
jgi:abortive infection bacteriophage resistance protein